VPDLAQWLPALVAVALAAGAFAQSLTGLGFSLIAAPATLAVFGPHDGVAIIVVLAAVASLLPLSHQWRHVGVRDAVGLLIPTLIATPVVVAALAGVDTSVVAVGAGIAVLIGVLFLARGVVWPGLRGVRGGVATGVASAVLNVVGGVGGPPVGMYATNAGWMPEYSRATLQFFFLIQNVVTALIIGYVQPPWWMFAALVVGTASGAAVAGRIPARTARLAVLVVAGLGGLGLVFANV
jgi:uncharacterized membrane protein YfcA